MSSAGLAYPSKKGLVPIQGERWCAGGEIAKGFVGGLAWWLASSSKLPVSVAERDEPIAPGHIYLAPDDRHLGVTSGGRVVTWPDSPVGGFRPSGTFLFESRALGAGALAVILTGMGCDGVEGLRR